MIMANKTIYIFRIGKIIARVLVTVTCVALCATWFIGWDRNAKVIDQVVLAMCLAFKTDDAIRIALPFEVTGIEHFLAFTLMTIKQDEVPSYGLMLKNRSWISHLVTSAYSIKSAVVTKSFFSNPAVALALA